MSNHLYPKDPAYYGPPPPPPPRPPPYPVHQPPPHQHPGHAPPIPHPQSYHPADTTDPASPYRGSYPGPMHPSFHNLYSSHSDFHSSSFESHGSSSNGASNGGSPTPYVGFPPYNHHHMPPPPGFYYPWSPPVEYIMDPLPQDVLCGRGGATNSHSGNRAFRSLVKQFQEHYLQAKKRDKPNVAAEVVFLVRKRGGRFLDRLKGPKSSSSSTQSKPVVYYDIGDRRATEKACQALREGAPKMKAKRGQGSSASTSSEEEIKYTASDESSPPHKRKKERISASSSSSFERTVDEKENVASAKNDDSSGHDQTTRSEISQNEGIILIQPSARLLRRAKVEPVSVNELHADEREIYLRDFLPPDPAIPSSEKKLHATAKPQKYKSDGSPPVYCYGLLPR